MQALPDTKPIRPRLPAAVLRSRQGFSLIEVMVSAAVLAILVVALSQLLAYSQDAMRLTESKKDRMQTARAINDFLGRELQCALLPINRPSQQDLQFIVNPASVSSIYRNHDSIFWQVPLASDTEMGDVAEVGYFVRWDLSKPANPRGLLCRFFLNPTSANYKIHTTPGDWIKDSMIEAVAPAVRTTTGDSYKGLFVENVIGIWVQCLDSSGKTIEKNDAGQPFLGASFDSRQGYTDSKGMVKTRGALPVSVDISLVLIDSLSAARLGVPEQNAIMALAADPNVKTANDFVARTEGVATLLKLRTGIRAFQTRIYLQGSK